MPRKRKPDKRIFFRTMEDALTARNNASESVKNASEVKQALLKKRRRTSTKFRDKRCGIQFYEDDVTYYGLRCKFCASHTEVYAGQLVGKDDGHLVFGSVAHFKVHLKSRTHKEKAGCDDGACEPATPISNTNVNGAACVTPAQTNKRLRRRRKRRRSNKKAGCVFVLHCIAHDYLEILTLMCPSGTLM